MKLNPIALLGMILAAAPAATYAGVDIGISIGGPEVVVRTQPPPERYEVPPPSPGPGYIWIRGHWGWRHEHWDWMGGHWDRVAQPGQEWVPGHWAERGGGWVWIEGRYITAQVPPPLPAGTQVEVVAAEAPPQPVVEVIPVAPGPDFFWVRGHWHWNHGWVWVGGRYERHPHFHPGAGWVDGHWDRRGASWVWHEGHWR